MFQLVDQASQRVSRRAPVQGEAGQTLQFGDTELAAVPVGHMGHLLLDFLQLGPGLLQRLTRFAMGHEPSPRPHTLNKAAATPGAGGARWQLTSSLQAVWPGAPFR